MDVLFVLLVGLVALGIAVYAAVQRHAVIAAVASVAGVAGVVVWAGETFDFLNV